MALSFGLDQAMKNIYSLSLVIYLNLQQKYLYSKSCIDSECPMRNSLHNNLPVCSLSRIISPIIK